MKPAKIVFAIFMAGILGAGGYGLYRYGMNRGMTMGASMAGAGDATSAANTERKVLYWHDPMVPGHKFDKPGKSPFMDMQLVPVYAGNSADEGKVSISPRVQQNLGIRTAEVTRGSVASALTAVGSMAYNERDVVLLQARSNGFVERLYVRAPLDPVRKGQVLAELYVPEWVAAQEEFLSVQRMQGSDLESLRDGARQRMRLVGMNDEQMRLVESSGKVQARSAIIAPIGGVITELTLREGMTVMAGAPLFRINGLGTIWVNAEVPEGSVAQVRAGVAVEARTPSLPETVFKGKVSAILPEVNLATRTLKARIELANPAGKLVPGMFASISFITPGRQNVLLVPTEAVIQTGTRNVVMVAQGEGKFVPVDVRIAGETNGQTEIIKGLEAGQKVVVSGQFLIDSEASLKGATTRMSDMPGQATTTHRGEGKIERIGKGEVTLSHAPMPSLQWGAMTMDFNTPAGGLPKGLAVGDSVTFEIRALKDGQYEITSIAPAPGATKEAMQKPADKAGAAK